MISNSTIVSLPVMKTWMSHGRMGYAKWVNYEDLYLLNVLAFMLKKLFSVHFYHGQMHIESFVKKVIDIKWNDPHVFFLYC